MLERWTNGLFKSTLHRVLNNGQDRYSTAFFVGTPPPLGLPAPSVTRAAAATPPIPSNARHLGCSWLAHAC